MVLTGACSFDLAIAAAVVIAAAIACSLKYFSNSFFTISWMCIYGSPYSFIVHSCRPGHTLYSFIVNIQLFLFDLLSFAHLLFLETITCLNVTTDIIFNSISACAHSLKTFDSSIVFNLLTDLFEENLDLWWKHNQFLNIPKYIFVCCLQVQQKLIE